MQIHQLKQYAIVNSYHNNPNIKGFKSKEDVIDDGDYVKISKKKYKKDKFWKCVDWTVAISAIVYWLYKAFNYKPPKV